MQSLLVASARLVERQARLVVGERHLRLGSLLPTQRPRRPLFSANPRPLLPPVRLAQRILYLAVTRHSEPQLVSVTIHVIRSVVHYNCIGATGSGSTPVISTGTSNPQYQPTADKDGAVTLQFQSISCMPQYVGYSFEVSVPDCFHRIISDSHHPGTASTGLRPGTQNSISRLWGIRADRVWCCATRPHDKPFWPASPTTYHQHIRRWN